MRKRSATVWSAPWSYFLSSINFRVSHGIFSKTIPTKNRKDAHLKTKHTTPQDLLLRLDKILPKCGLVLICDWTKLVYKL